MFVAVIVMLVFPFPFNAFTLFRSSLLISQVRFPASSIALASTSFNNSFFVKLATLSGLIFASLAVNSIAPISSMTTSCFTSLPDASVQMKVYVPFAVTLCFPVHVGAPIFFTLPSGIFIVLTSAVPSMYAFKLISLAYSFVTFFMVASRLTYSPLNHTLHVLGPPHGWFLAHTLSRGKSQYMFSTGEYSKATLETLVLPFKNTSFKLLHLANALLLISKTLAGIVILVRLLQLAKALFPISPTLSGIVILVRLLHLLKALIPMLVTPSGIVMLVRLLQP